MKRRMTSSASSSTRLATADVCRAERTPYTAADRILRRQTPRSAPLFFLPMSHHQDIDRSFGSLTPEFMLDALDAAGLYCDGRMLQLNSYENRVLQLHLEDGHDRGGVAVAKFYRPGRWSDAQILEEHAFARELAEAEVPVAAPWLLGQDQDAGTLRHYKGQRFAVTPRQGGRGPELEDPEVLTWVGRLLARIHVVGRQRPFEHRLRWDSAQPGRDARDWLLAHDSVPVEIAPAWTAVVNRCLASIQQASHVLCVDT
eukprot:Opistho-1_new@90210